MGGITKAVLHRDILCESREVKISRNDLALSMPRINFLSFVRYCDTYPSQQQTRASECAGIRSSLVHANLPFQPKEIANFEMNIDYDQHDVGANQLAALLASEDTASKLVLMGPNGAGKSRLLQNIRASLRSHEKAPKVIYLAASRKFLIDDTNERIPLTSDRSQDLDWSKIVDLISESGGNRGRRNSRLGLHELTGSMLRSLISLDEIQKSEFNKKAGDWLESGKVGPEPASPDSAIDSLKDDLLNAFGMEPIIPFESKKRTPLSFRKGNSEFPWSSLSDGEKQLLMLLALRAGTQRTEHLVFVIDEPELHLNDARAIEWWEAVEERFACSSFIYSTHSIAFATRPSIDNLYIVSDENSASRHDNNLPISGQTIRDIVGSRIQVMRTSRPIVFCEDQLMSLVLEDLLRGDNFEIVFLSGADSVFGAVRKDEGWAQLRTTDARCCGVIDRDARDDTELGGAEKIGVFALPTYDADGTLLEPVLARWALSISAGYAVSDDEYRQILTGAAHDRLNQSLVLHAKHVAAYDTYGITFKLNQDRTAFAQNPEFKANIALAEFNNRAEKIFDAIKKADSHLIIKLLEGKTLYPAFSSHARKVIPNGVVPSDATVAYRNLRSQAEFADKISSVQALQALRNKILKRMA